MNIFKIENSIYKTNCMLLFAGLMLTTLPAKSVAQTAPTPENGTRMANDNSTQLNALKTKYQDLIAEAQERNKQAQLFSTELEQQVQKSKMTLTQAKAANEKYANELVFSSAFANEVFKRTEQVAKRANETLSYIQWLVGIAVALSALIAIFFKIHLNSMVEKQVEKTIGNKVSSAKDELKKSEQSSLHAQLKFFAMQRQREAEDSSEPPIRKDVLFTNARRDTYCFQLMVREMVPDACEQLGAMKDPVALPFLKEARTCWREDDELKERIQDAIDEIKHP